MQNDKKVNREAWCKRKACVTLLMENKSNFKIRRLGLPQGPVAKYPPANAENMGSVLGPGRTHMPQNN